VITDLALLGFDPASKAMRLDGLQPGVSVEDVRANTGFELLMPASVPELAPPTGEELAVLTFLREGPPAGRSGAPAASPATTASPASAAEEVIVR
jgi:glutaconate CoA-transferase subunit B